MRLFKLTQIMLTMLKYNQCFLSVLYFIVPSLDAQVTFLPSTQNIVENSPVTLTCSYEGQLVLNSYTVQKNGTIEGSLLRDCSVFTKKPNETLYTVNCPNEKQLSWTIRNVTRANEGENWKCSLGFSTIGVEDADFIINVKVPIQSVEMTDPTSSSVTVKENNETVFVCRTSGGLPAATVRWYKDQGTTTTNDDVEITRFVTTTKSTIDGLISVTSTLQYSPRKEDNGRKIYCTASNSANTLTSSKKPQLNVQYSPDGPPEIQGFSNSETCYVIENKQRILSCSINGGNPLATLSWTCFNGGTTSTVGISVTKTVTFTLPRGQDRLCTCKSSHPVSGPQSVTVEVEVLYPPTIPEFLIKNTKVVGTVKVIKKNQVSITCKSTGQPDQIQYTWKHNSATTAGATLTTNNIQDGDQYMCEVENSMKPSDGSTVTGKNSSSLKFEVLYPPTIPTFQYWNTTGATIPNKVLNVIQNDYVKVACLSDSNPNPHFYQWDKRGNNQILTVSSITADKQGHKYKCEARNTMTETVPTTSNPTRGTSTSTLTVHVMYSPTNPTLKYRYGQGLHNLSTNSLSVREYNPTAFIVTCESNSMPEPVIVWENITPSSPILTLKNLERSKAGNYNCKAENIMNRTFGNPEKVVYGRNFQSFELNILYAPEVGMLNNRSIAEGLPFDYNCTVKVGNPKETTTKWLKSDNTVLISQMLTIPNVSRADAGNYTCTADNIMKQTGEQTATKGEDSQSFYLNVWYRASVTDFYVVGFPGKTSVTVNETSNKVPFHCDVNSNPGSFMTIKKEEQQLNSGSDRKSLEYVLPSASCLDAGIYTCCGNNDYNTEKSMKQLTFFVNCSPRKSPHAPLLKNVTSQQNKPAVLSFTALAYPIPSKDDFQWFRKANGQWLPLLNNAAFKTDTVNLQTNLTILSVNRTLFGMYKLTVKNSIGEIEQIFHLVPEDKPEVPTNFIHKQELVTESSFTVQWKPGFDNGPEQTFILKYRKESQQAWTVVKIPDTEETLMNYTASDLSSGSNYQVVLYATNRLGNSSETDMLTITTKDVNNGGGNMALIGGLCGGGAALILIVVLVVVVFKRRGTFIKGKAKRYQENSDRKPVNEDDDDYGMQDNPMYVSAGPRGQAAGGSSGAGAVYSTVDKKKNVPDSNKNDVYAEVDKTRKSKKSVPDNVYSMPLKQKGKKEKEKKEKNKHGNVKDKKGKKATQEGDIYENATPANQGKNDEIIYENPEPSKEVSKKNVNKDGLIYADLTFNDQPKGQKKLVIHGLDDMTEYVQVDFTKKAEPLPDSDDENNPPK